MTWSIFKVFMLQREQGDDQFLSSLLYVAHGLFVCDFERSETVFFLFSFTNFPGFTNDEFSVVIFISSRVC